MRLAAFLMLSLVSSAHGAQLVLSKPAGGSVTIQVANVPARVDARTGDVTLTAVASAGIAGDGWCPTGTATAPTMTSPSVYLTLPGGARYRIPLATGSNPSWTPGVGNWSAMAKANSGVPGDGWCPTVSAPAPTFTTQLTGQPAAISVGQQSMLTWATANATTCSTSGSTYPAGVTSVPGWNASMPLSSTGVVVTLTTAGTYTFRLSCSNATGTAISTATVTVSGGGGGGTSCTGANAPPSGKTRQTSFILDPVDLWAASNTDWPFRATIDTTAWNPPPPGQVDSSGVNRSFLGRFGSPVGDTGTIEIKSNHYMAFKFETAGQSGKAGFIGWEQPGQNGAPLLVTISPCPGDFNPAQATCKSNGSAATGIGWTTGVSAPSYCTLTAGTTYYLNVIFGTPANPGQNTCSFPACRWLFNQSCQAGCN